MSVAASPIDRTVSARARVRCDPLTVHVPLDSVQSPWTGLIGTLILLLGSIFCGVAAARGILLPLHEYRYVFVLLLVFTSMAGYELLVLGVHERQFDFSRPRRIGPPERRNIALRAAGLAGSLALASVMYVTLGEYQIDLAQGLMRSAQASWYRPFFHFFLVASVIL